MRFQMNETTMPKPTFIDRLNQINEFSPVFAIIVVVL